MRSTYIFAAEIMGQIDIILAKSADLFMRYGVKSNTMDDIAKNLGMSKKTLYQFFSNKEDLLEKCIKGKFQWISAQLDIIAQESSDAIDELFSIDSFIIEQRVGRNPALFHEMAKFYPELLGNMERLNQEHITKRVKTNIERGIKEQLFRGDIKSDLIATLYSSRLESLVHERLNFETEYSFETLIQENLIYHIRGIASLSGLVKLQEKLTELPEDYETN